MRNWCLEIWGDYACFTRPEMKVERVSYDVITPSAARAIFEAILWKPAIQWHVTKIEVFNPIKWISIRRNEVGKIATSPTAKQYSGQCDKPMGIFIEEARQQRTGLLLKDIRYRIYGYFDFIPIEKRESKRTVLPEFWADVEEETLGKDRIDETAAKYAAMFERRAKKGQCFHRPYLGCREFACNFKLIDPKIEAAVPIDKTCDLGFMLYDIDYTQNKDEPTPRFFRAIMNQGSINTNHKQIEVRG